MLPDSSVLVYCVMPNHPLGLKPGDIILGYDGVPWKRLIRELFDAELPVLTCVGAVVLRFFDGFRVYVRHDRGDGTSSDSIWGAFVRSPIADGRYSVSVRTDDKTAGTSRRLPNSASFIGARTGVKAIA